MGPDGITDSLLQYGVLGIVALVFGWVIRILWQDSKLEREALLKQMNDLHNARVADAQRHQQEMAVVIKSCTEALTTVTATLGLQREAMGELRDSFKELADELKSIVESRRNQ